MPVDSLYLPAIRYKHVENCLHLRRGQILLRDRPWRFKLRLNVGDHLVSSYTAGQPLKGSMLNLLILRTALDAPMHHVQGTRALPLL